MGDRQRMFKRVDEMISEDKEWLSAECKRLAAADFFKVAKEYFEVKGQVEINVEKQGATYAVTVVFAADRVKNCYFIK